MTGLRVGLQALYALHDHGEPLGRAGDRVGVDVHPRTRAPELTTTLDVGGWEFVNLQAGYDVDVSPGWKVGPWISGSVGEFSRASLGVDGQNHRPNIPNKAVHGWLQLGVKGSFGP